MLFVLYFDPALLFQSWLGNPKQYTLKTTTVYDNFLEYHIKRREENEKQKYNNYFKVLQLLMYKKVGERHPDVQKYHYWVKVLQHLTE